MANVVITGAGCVTPLGNNVDKFTKEIDDILHKAENEYQQNRYSSNIKRIRNFKFDDDKMLAQFLRLDISCQYILEASRQALESAKLLDEKIIKGKRLGVIIGTTYGVFDSIEKFLSILQKTKNASPILFKQTAYNLLSGIIAYKYKIDGYNTTIYNGWTAGLDAIILAEDLILNEVVDIVLVGGVDILNDTIITYMQNSYTDIESLKEIIMGEGAGVIILERKELFLQRKAEIKGELLNLGQKLFYENDEFLICVNDILNEEFFFDNYFANINGTTLDEYEIKAFENANIKEKSIFLKCIMGECGAASGILQIIYALHKPGKKSIILNASNIGRLSYALIKSY